jgi:hypothetical protein
VKEQEENGENDITKGIIICTLHQTILTQQNREN